MVTDTTGIDDLHGGQVATLPDVVARMAAGRRCARAAGSATWGASRALARVSADGKAIVSAGELAHALGGSPIWALRLDPERKLGSERMRDSEATPREP